MARIIAARVLVGLWLSLLAPQVEAAPPGWLSAAWAGPSACVDTTSLQARAARLLGDGPPPPVTRVDLSAVAQAETWRIDLRIEAAGEVAQRSLSGPDCDTLTEAVALVIAVHVDPLSVATNLPVTAAPDTSALPPIVVTPVPTEDATQPDPSVDALAPDPSRPANGARKPAPVPSKARARHAPPARPRLTLGAAAMAELGVLPIAAAAFEPTIGVLWPRARLELSGIASVGPDATSPVIATVRGTLRLYAAALRGCGVVGRARLEVPLCGALEAGDLRGASSGLDDDDTVNAPWIAAVLGARPRLVVRRRIALGGVVDLLVPFRRYRFFVPNAGTLHTVAPLGARLGLSVEVRLP